MPKFKVNLYNTVYWTAEVEAEDEESAEEEAWSSGGPAITLPESVSLGEEWKIDGW